MELESLKEALEKKELEFEAQDKELQETAESLRNWARELKESKNVMPKPVSSVNLLKAEMTQLGVASPDSKSTPIAATDNSNITLKDALGEYSNEAKREHGLIRQSRSDDLSRYNACQENGTWGTSRTGNAENQQRHYRSFPQRNSPHSPNLM